MASQCHSQTVIKDEIFEDWNMLPQCELLDSSVHTTDSYEELKHFSLSAVKEEVGHEADPLLPEPPFPIAPACVPRRNCITHPGLGRRREVTLRKSSVPHELLRVKKLLKLTLPKKHICSKWTKQTTESILMFLNSFVTFARGPRLTHSADRSMVLKGPRILKCEECFLEFSGLFDRYLKLFLHYKAAHRLKCNILIGRKWIKHKASLDIMVEAWKMDLRYELHNLLSSTVQ